MKYEDNFQARWMALFPDSALRNRCLEVYRDVRTRYDEKHRRYHNMEHVGDCLDHLDTVRDEIGEPTTVELAIWFHDVIYKPLSRQNEEDSAQLARKQLRTLGMSEKSLAGVYHLVLLTKHPTIPQGIDEEYLLDIDLAVLGADPKTFATYNRNIRVEYKWVPRFVYRRNRAKLIERILAQDYIYRTPRFRDEREAQAQENLATALADLR